MELYVVKQESLYLEKLVKNGGSKDVHYVVKNTPFTIHYGIKNFEEGSTFNFNKCKVNCSLMIDMNPPKDVEYISKKPMDYVIHPTTKGGNECSIEFRVKVLTTQMEGSLFLIRTSLVGSDGKVLEVTTMPIKSVSKPEQVRRKMAKENNSTAKSTPSRKKRTRSDELLEILQTIQNEQKQQSEMLNNVVGYMMTMGMYFNEQPNQNINNTLISNSSTNQENSEYTEENKSLSGPDELEVAFNNLMTAYNKLNPSLRPTKLRKVMHDNKNSVELNDMVSNFGNIQNEAVPQTHDSTHLDTCNCSSCPARKELEQLNNFYMDFLHQEDLQI